VNCTLHCGCDNFIFTIIGCITELAYERPRQVQDLCSRWQQAVPFQATTITVAAVLVADQITEAQYLKTTSQASCMTLPKRIFTQTSKPLISFASTLLIKPSLALYLNSAYPNLGTHKVQDAFLGDHIACARSKRLACPCSARQSSCVCQELECSGTTV